MVCFCAADLLWATKIKSTAESLGISCRPVRNLEMLEARLVDSPVRALIVDLEAGPVAIELIRRAGRGGSQRPRILAFGPHVDTASLDAARQAGAEAVLPRGAFNARLPELLRELDAESSTP